MNKIDKSKIGLEFRVYYKGMFDKEIEQLLFWLYWKDKPYPLNYIGHGIYTVSESLKISIEEAKQLFIEKVVEILPTIENEDLKYRIEKRIKTWKRGNY